MSNKPKRAETTVVDTFKSYIEGFEGQVETWRENFDEDEDIYVMVGEWHNEKWPKYSTKTPKDAGGRISKVAYAPDVFQDEVTKEALKESDKQFFGTLTIKNEAVENPSHKQVYTPEEFVQALKDKQEELEENHAIVSGVLYDGYQVSAATSNDYKRFAKQKFDPEIFTSAPDNVKHLPRKTRKDWYGTIIVKEEYLTEEWQERLQDKREGGDGK